MMNLETLMAESLGDNFFRFDYDSNRILNVTTGKLMPRVRGGSIEVPETPEPDRTPTADAINAAQENGELKIYSFDKLSAPFVPSLKSPEQIC